MLFNITIKFFLGIVLVIAAHIWSVGITFFHYGENFNGIVDGDPIRAAAFGSFALFAIGITSILWEGETS